MSSRPARLVAAVFSIAALGAGLWLWQARRSAAPQPAFARVALLPIENQSGDATLDSFAALTRIVLASQFASAPRLQLTIAASTSDPAAARATTLLSGFVTREGGANVVHYFLHSAATRKIVGQGTVASPAPAWPNLQRALATSLAPALAAGFTPKPPSIHADSTALALADALSAPDAAAADARFNQAVTSDPACAPCWLLWAQSQARRGAAEPLSQLLARARRTSLEAATLGRLALLEAGLRNDPQARHAALLTLAAALPADFSIQSELAQSLTARRHFAPAIEAFRRALAIEPENAETWNLLAYAHAYAGRFDDALSAVARYGLLDKASANPADSRGEIELMAGRFAQAAASFTASYERDKNYNGGAALEKAAMARLLNGERELAGPLLDRLLKDREAAHDPAAALTRARWEYLTGRTADAVARLRSIAASKDDPAAPIAAALAATRLASEGRIAEARALAAQARATARNNAHALFAAMAAAAVDPASPASIPDAALRAEFRALALTLHGPPAEAAAAWRASLQLSEGGADALQRELLAASLVAAGRTAEARQALDSRWPLLAPRHLLAYDFLVFPELFYTRAELARAEGKAADSRRFYDLFLLFAGDRPDPAGRIARARAAARL